MTATARLGRIFLFAAWCFAFVSHPLFGSESPASSFLGLVTADRVNVRSTPRLSAEILTTLSKGEKVHVVERKGSWYGVRLPPEVSLYVAKEFLRIESDKAFVIGRDVHIRCGAGKAFTSVGLLPEGLSLHVRRAGLEWLEVTPPPFCRGWIHETYVTFLEPEEVSS